MRQYVAWRILQAIPLLLLLSLFVYGMLHLAPGDPASYLIPEAADPEQARRIRDRLGLDDPFLVQYLRWLGNAVRGDFGSAYTYGEDVLTLIRSRLRPTLELQIAAITLSLVIAIPVGVISAVKRHSLFDHVTTTGSLFGLSMPDFWFALMLVLVFSLQLDLLPSFGAGSGSLLERLPHFVLPVTVLGLSTVPWFARIMRSSMLDVLAQDFLRTARAKGARERRVITRHAIRVALLPVVTMLGLTMARLVSGSIIVETVFAWPGLGRLVYDAIIRSDYPLIMALTMLSGVFIIALNVVVDILYGVLDPRVQLAKHD